MSHRPGRHGPGKGGEGRAARIQSVGTRAALAVLLAVLAALVLASCAKPYKTYDSAFQVFDAFRTRYLGRPPAGQGVVTQSSLVYRAGTRQVRILIDFWGLYGRPLRMDAWSSVGGSLAHILEDDQGLAAYYPDQAKVYTHRDPVAGARLLGLPFPFSLADLADVLTGRFDPLVPGRYASAQAGPGAGFTYSFSEGDVTELVLDAGGRPVRITGRLPELVDSPWPPEENVFVIEFEKYPSDREVLEDGRDWPPLSKFVNVTLPGDRHGALRIKHRQIKVGPWPEGALTMQVPQAVIWQLLDREPRDWTTGAIITLGDEPGEAGTSAE